MCCSRSGDQSKRQASSCISNVPFSFCDVVKVRSSLDTSGVYNPHNRNKKEMRYSIFNITHYNHFRVLRLIPPHKTVWKELKETIWTF